MDLERYLREFAATSCDCKKAHRFTISKIIVEKNAIDMVPEQIEKFGCKKPFILADKNTFNAAGNKLCKLFEEKNISYSKHILPSLMPEPDENSVGNAVMHFDSSCDLVISVGSGVINDIGKILANTSGLPYFIIGTAPSMDGYASATSSMSMDGLKVSLPSTCADVIIGDIDVLSNAPIKMMISGLGDMLAKYVSICEWRISHLINGEYYCEKIAELVRSSLKKCVENAEGLLKRDEKAVKSVFEGLIVCGAAMKFAGLSRPASGTEHYLSHIWDMRGLEFGTPVELHGIQCAVGTLISIELYEKLKSIVPDEEKAFMYVQSFDFSLWSEELREFLGRGADSMIALEEKEQKYNKESHKKRIARIIENWGELQKIIKEELPTIREIKKLYDKVGLPKTMTEIGLSEEILPLTFKSAKDIRDKYVLPRLCWDLGIIDEIFEL